MATRIENHCVDCPQGCINCGRRYVEVEICDAYGCDDYAIYITDEGYFCENCLEKYLNKVFENLSLSEKIDALKEIVNIQEV